MKLGYMCRMSERDFVICEEGDIEEEANIYEVQKTGLKLEEEHK